MKVVDPGHVYQLAHLDGTGESTLTFVKRDGPEYPGNVGAHEGVTIQEVLRACIDRVKYVNAQARHDTNDQTLAALREALDRLEARAAMRRHDWNHYFEVMREFRVDHGWWLRAAPIEDMPVCGTCGHIACRVADHRVGQQPDEDTCTR